jgi:CheY-like chemotaxis protein
VDVILADINMPGSMNGFGFAHCARSIRPSVPRVASIGLRRGFQSFQNPLNRSGAKAV